MSASAVAGTVELTTERETAWCFGWYAFFLATFAVLARFFVPGIWAMHLHDSFGNAALLFFLLSWSRKDRRRQLFVCLLLGGQVLAAYTHIFDVIVLNLAGAIPEGMWRPHNILHTPLAAIVVSLVATPLVRLVLRAVAFREAFFFLLVGYAMHIVMDAITYAYPVYLLWPASPWSASLVSVFQQPDAVSRWLGNPLYVFAEPGVENIDGYIVYRSEVAVNLLLAALVAVKAIARRILGRVA